MPRSDRVAHSLRSFAVAPETKIVELSANAILTTTSETCRRYGFDGALQAEIAGSCAAPQRVTIKGRKLFLTLASSGVNVSDEQTGKLLYTRVAGFDGEWLVFTPQGHFDLSSDKAKVLIG